MTDGVFPAGRRFSNIENQQNLQKSLVQPLTNPHKQRILIKKTSKTCKNPY
jgi:hypothetical protein